MDPTPWFFPSNGTASVAGVGILVTESFLAKFDPIPAVSSLPASHWEEFEPGRAACLHLRGPEGGMDIVTCYST